MSTTNQITGDVAARTISAACPQFAMGGRKTFKAAKAGLLVGALLLGSVAPSRATVLFQTIQDTLDNAILGTNALLGVSITLEPVNQTVAVGSAVALSVAATGPSLQYEWMLNGYLIPGATNATLNLANLTADSCGAYRAVVYNGIDADWSTLAYVQVTAAALPLADNFSSRVSVAGLSGFGSGTTQGATKEAADPKPASGILFHTLWLTWIAPSNGPVEMNTVGSAIDTWLGVYTGTVQSNLVAVATDDDDADYGNSSVEFNAKAGTAYQIMIGARDYRAAPILFSWNLAPAVTALPTITASPTNITTTPGSPASLSLQFQSTLPTAIQWFHNGQLMAGAAQNSLQWAQLSPADLGSYQAVLTSAQWVYQLPPVEIQFNTEGLARVAARKKLADAIGTGLMGH
jgi:hypothetical protein